MGSGSPSLLLGFSVFGAASLLVAFLAFLLQKGGNRRPDMKSQKTEQDLARFQASYTMAGFRRGAILTGVGLAVVIFAVTQNIVFAFFPAVIGLVLPLVYPWWVKRSYIETFEYGFSECLDTWVRCLQAGLSLQQAVAAAASDMSGPAANEMKTLQKEMSLGDVETALWHLFDRVPIEDVKYAVLGVITCRQTGGRMSEVVTNIAEAIRERAAQRERIKAITSMGRTEAYIMAVMPFAIGAMMYWLQPDTMSFLFTHPVGIIGCCVAVLWEAVGLLVIWHIVNVKP